MSPHHAWTLLLLFVVTLAPASAKQERLREELITVLQSDVPMNSAIARACEGLAAFWEVFSQRKSGAAELALEARGTGNDRAAHFLTGLLRHHPGETAAADGDTGGSATFHWLGTDMGFTDADPGTGRGMETAATGSCGTEWARSGLLAEVEWCRQLLAEP